MSYDQSDFEIILETNSIDSYLSKNKYEPDNIIEFVNYTIQLDTLSFSKYLQILEFIIEQKIYSEMPTLYLKMISKLMERMEYEDVYKFMMCTNKFSSNIISKFKTSENILQIINNLVDLSLNCLMREWKYECSVMIENTASFIMNCNVYPSKAYIVKYFEILAQLLLEANYFKSFMNCINNVMLIDNTVASKFGNYDEYTKISEYSLVKDEDNKFSQLLLKIKIQDCNSILEKLDVSNTTDKGLIRKYVNFEFWDILLKYSGSEIPKSEIFDNADYKLNQFLCFLMKNDIQYKIKENTVSIGKYAMKSTTDNVYDIIDKYKDEQVEIKKPECKRKDKKKVDSKKEEVKPKKKHVEFPDNFTEKKARYAVYCETFEETYEDMDVFYVERNMLRNIRHEEYNNKLKKRIETYKKYKDEVDKLYAELQRIIKEDKFNIPERRTESSSINNNWRYGNISISSTNISRENNKFKPREVVEIKRNVYAYNDSSTSLLDFESTKDNDTYRPIIKPRVKKEDDTYKPPILNIKMKRDDDTYKPPVLNIKVPSRSLLSSTKMNNSDDTYKPPMLNIKIPTTKEKNFTEKKSSDDEAYIPPTRKINK